MVRNPVLLILVVAGLASALGLAFLGHAPNRILSGQPVTLASLLTGERVLVLLPAAIIASGMFALPSRVVHVAMGLAGVAFVLGLVWLAGAAAAGLADPARPAGRTSFGAGFWALVAVGWLVSADAGRRIAGPWARLAFGTLALAGIGALLATGRLDQLSLAKELDSHKDVFLPAVLRHAQIVGVALVPTLLLGLPLGIAAFRSPALRGPLFAALNVVQTIPSIALFGLLMVPLSALADLVPALPAMGVSGIGLAPAAIALTLYSLLPIARATAAGLGQAPRPVVEAARGIGFTRAQVFRSVELPLALPVILSGLRVTLVQAIGLAAVAALIGAGGLGAIMFQGLFSSAADLVLLGVVPVVMMAVVADATLGALVAVLRGATP
jgi:osmoprotectant transport system permease protein